MWCLGARQTSRSSCLMSFVHFVTLSDSCCHCGFNYFENSKEVCTWKILTALCSKILPLFLRPFSVHRFGLCGRELWGKHFNPLLSCCSLFRITGSCRGCTEIMRCLWTCQVKLQRENVRLSHLGAHLITTCFVRLQCVFCWFQQQASRETCMTKMYNEDCVVLAQDLASTFEEQGLCCQVDRALDRSLRIMCLSSAYTLSHCVMPGKLLQLFPPTGNRGPCFTVGSVRDSVINSDYHDTVLCQSWDNHC